MKLILRDSELIVALEMSLKVLEFERKWEFKALEIRH